MGKDDLIKADILEAASTLFQKWGLNKTTMEDIAKEIGKGKSALYYYYASKEDIFIEVITKEIRELIQIISDRVEKETKAEQKFRVYVEASLTEFEKYQNLYKFNCGETMCNFELIRKIADMVEREIIHLIGSILFFGIENGEFKNKKNQDIPMMSYIIANALHGIQHGSIIHKTQIKNTSQIDILNSILLDGLKG
ncbi:MAG TPA: TetR/AcrR family transcriptional regulator [Spirochaetota bacterium]